MKDHSPNKSTIILIGLLVIFLSLYLTKPEESVSETKAIIKGDNFVIQDSLRIHFPDSVTFYNKYTRIVWHDGDPYEIHSKTKLPKPE